MSDVESLPDIAVRQYGDCESYGVLVGIDEHVETLIRGRVPENEQQRVDDARERCLARLRMGAGQ